MNTQQAERKRSKIFWLWSLLKPLCFLAVVISLVVAYKYRQVILTKLDPQPLSTFALLGKPTYTTAEDIRTTLGKYGQLKGYFGQNIQELQQQLAMLPWIKQVMIKKEFPNRLLIKVQDRVPVARWNAQQSNNEDFLASDGTIFSLPLEKQQNLELPDLAGPDFQRKTVLIRWQQIIKDLSKTEIKPVALAVDERGSWQIRLANGIILNVGRDNWKAKIARFITIYPHIDIPTNQKIDYIDLRYKDGIAVSFTNIPETTPEQVQ